MHLIPDTARLVLIEDLGALRRKLSFAPEPLATYWRNFLELAATEPIGEFQALPPLAWLITGEARYARAARAVFLQLLEQLPLAEASVEAQVHAYTAGMPMARFALYLDWIWDGGILSAAERQALADRLVTQVYSHCYLRLKGRLPAADNQQTSMAFCCAVTGYLFGVKRGASPAAQRMGREGFRRYRIVLESLGAGGWCGEGSTYHHQVMVPIMALFTAFMEQVTGADYFNRQVGAATVRDALTLATDTINGAGMLPGWDQYGNCAPELKTHFAWLARKTGDPAPLAAIARHGMWSENELLAWYNDDKVWTLVFWPDDAAAAPATGPEAPRSWLNPPVCAKLVSADASLDLLQMWDEVGAGRPGRLHISPNNIELCTHGALHTADGQGPAADRSYFTCADGLSFAAAHSVVLVDGEGYRYPDTPWHGRGECLVDLPALKAVRGDVSDLYDTLWNVRAMRRTSLLLGERLVLLHDRFQADRPHRFTWQLMLRPDVTVASHTARQRLREGPVLDIATVEGHVFARQELTGYPRGLEQRAHRLWFDVEAAGDGAIPVVLRAQPGTVTVADLSAGWAVVTGDHGIPDGLFDTPGACDLSRDALTGSASGRTLWFGRRLELTAAEAAATRLAIQRGQVDRLEVFVNGVPAPELFDHPSIQPGCRDVHKPDGRFWPSHFDVRGLLRPGGNEVAIASSEFRGQSICGPIRLLRLAESEAVPLTVHDHGTFLTIADGDAGWTVIPENRERALVTLSGGIETDAEVAALGSAGRALARVTRYREAGLTLNADVSLDLELDERTLTVRSAAGTPFRLTLDCAAGSFAITQDGVAGGQILPWMLRLDPYPGPRSVERMPLRPEEPVFPDAPATQRLSPYDAGFVVPPTGTPTEREALTRLLEDTDWRVQVSAVQAIGERGHRWAVPALVALLERENALPPAATKWGNWPFAKMKTTFLGWADPAMPESVRRGHRLKTVILKALGKLGVADHGVQEAIATVLERRSGLYPALVQGVKAAEALGLTELLPTLESLTTYHELNTRLAACQAVATLKQKEG